MIGLIGRVLQVGPEIGMRNRNQLADTLFDRLAPEMGYAVFGHDLVDHGPGNSDNRAFRKKGQNPGNQLSADQTGGG